MKLEEMPELKHLDRIEVEYHPVDKLPRLRYKVMGYFCNVEDRSEIYPHKTLYFTDKLVNNDVFGEIKGIQISHIVGIKVLQS